MTPRTVEKITVVVVVAVLGTALAVNVRGAPVWLLMLALAVTVSAGMDLVLRGEARYHPTPDLFILPAAVVVGGVLFISLLTGGAAIVAGLAVLGALLFGVFWAEYATLQPYPETLPGPVEPLPVQPGGPSLSETALLRTLRRGPRPASPERRLAETALIAIGYVTAFVLYAAVYQARERSLLSAPAIIAISFVLAARQLRLAHEPRLLPPDPVAAQEIDDAPSWPRTLMYSAAVALCAGEVTWALNYWPLNGLLGGAFLLATFYFLIGVFSQHLQRRLTGRLLAEYGAVAAAGTLLITLAGLVRRGG